MRSASGPRRARPNRSEGSAGSAALSSSSAILQTVTSSPPAAATSPSDSSKLRTVPRCASWRGTRTGFTRWPSRPTTRLSPREAGTARSGSGTWPTASLARPSSPHQVSSPRPAEAGLCGKTNPQASAGRGLVSPGFRHGSNAGHSSGVAQGQRSLNRCSGRDFQHEVFAPTGIVPNR